MQKIGGMSGMMSLCQEQRKYVLVLGDFEGNNEGLDLLFAVFF